MPVRRPSSDDTSVCSDDFAACARLRRAPPPTAADAADAEYAHAELVLAAAGGEWHRAIALANAAVAEDSPRKITRAAIDALRVRSGHETAVVDVAGLRHILGLLVAMLPSRAPLIGATE